MKIGKAVAACALALGGTAALAQQNTSELVVEEIIVTARKTSESLQTVPVAITAFTAADIEAAGIRDLRDIAMHTLYGDRKSVV